MYLLMPCYTRTSHVQTEVPQVLPVTSLMDWWFPLTLNPPVVPLIAQCLTTVPLLS